MYNKKITMLYPGSKNRVRNELTAIMMQHHRMDKPFVDLFCGGCNLIAHIPQTVDRYANDNNKYVIALFKSLLKGWRPPNLITEELYNKIKKNPDSYPPQLVAFAATTCSYAGFWFGTYARNIQNYNYALVGCNTLARQINTMQGIKFSSADYREFKIAKGSTVYLDPPYEDTREAYLTRNFDSKAFWQYAAALRETTYISSFKAPAGFIEVFRRKLVTVNNRQTDKLFVNEYTWDKIYKPMMH